MEGFSPIDVSSITADSETVHPEETSTSEPMVMKPNNVPTGLPCGDENQAAPSVSDIQVEPLYKLFDKVISVQRRRDQMRRELDTIDHILISARSVAGLAEKFTETLLDGFGLEAAAILIAEDQAIASYYRDAIPTGMGLVSFDRIALPDNGIQIVNDLDFNYTANLFGHNSPKISSAIIAPLMSEGRPVGVLCLGSKDPDRYTIGMDTELISGLAEKLSLAVSNAWAHESASRNALLTPIEGVYTEPFFMEYLYKQFSRAWRKQSAFTLIAAGWSPADQDSSEAIMELISNNIRCADLCAKGEMAQFWILLPDTGIEGAKVVANRLTDLSRESFSDRVKLTLGLASFSNDCFALSMLLNRAISALREASESEDGFVVAEA